MKISVVAVGLALFLPAVCITGSVSIPQLKRALGDFGVVLVMHSIACRKEAIMRNAGAREEEISRVVANKEALIVHMHQMNDWINALIQPAATDDEFIKVFNDLLQQMAEIAFDLDIQLAHVPQHYIESLYSGVAHMLPDLTKDIYCRPFHDFIAPLTEFSSRAYVPGWRNSSVESDDERA